MPRTALTVQRIDRDGLVVSYTAGDSINGHEFANSTQDVFLHIKNGGASSINVTLITSATIDGLAVADKVVAVAAAAEKFIGPFANGTYGQEDNLVHVDLSDDTSVTLAAIRPGQR